MKNTEIYQKAVDKIRDEMAKESGNPGIQFLGGWLTGELDKHPELADKLLDGGKSIKGGFDRICDYASKHKTGNFAFVPPEKALEIVGEYYGFDAEGEPQAIAKEPETAELDLDALLGGL